MEGFANQSAVLQFAYWVAVLTLLLSFTMLIVIVYLRVRAQRRARRDRRAREHWSDIMRRVLTGEDIPVRALGRSEAAGFIEAWNTVHAPLADAASRRLAALGHHARLVAASRPMLRGGYHARAMAIVALGYLRDPGTFDALAPFLGDRSPIVSLCAARALGQVDPPRAMAMFVPMILDREDWVPGNVARILAENPDGSAARELGNALLRANASTTARLVRFLADIDHVQAEVVIRRLLDSTVDDHVISVCLQLVQDREDRERVIGRLAAARWHVRMHAATALGRIGEAADAKHLEPLLADQVWWVRYRAAQAVLALPGAGADALRHMQQRQTDAYGRDIAEQVLSEHDLGQQVRSELDLEGVA